MEGFFDRKFTKAMDKKAESCPHLKNKRDKVLEMVLNRHLEALSLKFVKGSREAATDGILDMAELFDLVVTGERIIQRIESNLEQAVHFVSRGRIVGEKDGYYALCYNEEDPCTRQTWEACSGCPRRCSRFVPKEFYERVHEIVDRVRNVKTVIETSEMLRLGV